MAVAARPRVLVLDEPTTALDVVTQAAVLDLVADLGEQLGMAVLLVSHDLGVVSAMADEIAVMRAGEVVEHAATAALFAAPQHEYTRALLAAVPDGRRPGGTGHVPDDATVPGTVGSTATRTAPPERAARPVVTADDLVIRYGRGLPAAVDGVSFTIAAHETLAVVGESGSGKSTLATALAGLVPAESGTFTYDDGTTHGDLRVPIAGRAADLRRAVQLVFQNADTSLNPRRTVGAAIARPLRLFSGSSSRERGRDAPDAGRARAGVRRPTARAAVRRSAAARRDRAHWQRSRRS
ncbi:ATP-binding cassette domain-containing protein [Curtobacterium flaccumfaciens]|nr:ATP-binding cassette domain-containing protein [Curtobacterium flaccumfaciens]